MSEQENGVSLVTLLTKCRDDHLPNGFVNADDVFHWDAKPQLTAVLTAPGLQNFESQLAAVGVPWTMASNGHGR